MYGNLGNVYLSMWDLGKAIEYYANHLTIAKEVRWSTCQGEGKGVWGSRANESEAGGP